MVLNLSRFSFASSLLTPPIQYCEIIEMVCNGRADDAMRSLASSSPVQHGKEVVGVALGCPLASVTDLSGRLKRYV